MAADDLSLSSLAARVRSGEAQAVARAISIVESGGEKAAALVSGLYRHAGRAWIVGITGAPGAGKSTLTGQLIAAFRARHAAVAVLAVDPSSPFTGGALLGDRVRMQGTADDPEVFIRSMATRGQLGGLAAATADAAVVLDTAGFEIILIETVGVGQDEIDIVKVADVCIVVTMPGTGDEVQAMKAGIMEAADIFVVNKADRDGADEAAAALEQAIRLDGDAESPRPAVVRTIATEGEGIDALLAAIDARRDTRASLGRRSRYDRADRRLRDVLSSRAVARLRTKDDMWRAAVERIETHRQDPYSAADALLDRVGATDAIDHVGIATDDLEVSLRFFRDVLGYGAGEAEDVASQGVRVRFLDTGAVRLEMIEALDETSPFAASVRTRGAGLHHLALRVSDLEATLDRLAAAGVALVDREPRPGAHGTRVAFVHPSSSRGVLIELVERKGGGAGADW